MRNSIMRILSLSFAVLLVACGGGKSSFDLDGGADGTTPDDGGTNPDSPFGFGDTGGGDGGGCARGCSSDLHDVLDCNNNVVQTCTGTDGCDVSTGTCVNACQAAVNNKNSIGCEYYATFMDQYDGSGACFVAFVANTWNTNVSISVDFNGTTLSNVASFTRIPSGKGQSITYGTYPGSLAPGQVAILFLGGVQGSAPQCPIATAEGTAAMTSGTGIGHSFHIVTDVPTVAYEMNPYGGGNAAVTGASLLLPVSSWDTNYIASTASAYYVGNPNINIIAAQDNTQVTILPKVALAGGNGIPSSAANSPATFKLMKGQQAQIAQQADLVGSVISSNVPVGVMAGNSCMNTPTGTIFCDHGEQMLPPVRALGSEYVGVMYRSRTGEPAIWRLVGAVDATSLTFSPSIGAGSGFTAPPTTLNQGQMAEFSTATPFIVKSQDDKHPFMLFQYMSGSGWTYMKNSGGFGDPDFSVQVPPQQYLEHYVIMTDPSYPETALTLIRRPDAKNNFQDVKIDCLTTPITGWQTVGAYQYAYLDLQTGDFKDVNGCSNGRHELTSLAPFGLGVWGWGTPNTSSFTANVSYSYPGGMNVQPINSVVVPPTPH
jgi:hypothetical protein